MKTLKFGGGVEGRAMALGTSGATATGTTGCGLSLHPRRANVSNDEHTARLTNVFLNIHHWVRFVLRHDATPKTGEGKQSSTMTKPFSDDWRSPPSQLRPSQNRSMDARSHQPQVSSPATPPPESFPPHPSNSGLDSSTRQYQESRLLGLSKPCSEASDQEQRGDVASSPPIETAESHRRTGRSLDDDSSRDSLWPSSPS
mgnify:CR=1 FL=1